MKKNLIFLLLAISIILLSLIKNSFISFFDTNSKDILTFEKIPKFSSKSLFEDNKVLTDTDIINKITIINFFASWCIPCKAEHDLLMSLKKKFPEIKEPKKEDICYATTNRQAAVKKIAKKCDMFFVIGSRNS